MKGLTAQTQISEGRRCLRSFLNCAGSCYIFFGSCVSALCVYLQDAVARLRLPDPPTQTRWRERPGDLLNPHTQKNTCLFARLQFTIPEIPSEPVTGVQEGTGMVVRGYSATYFWRRSLTHFSLPTPTATSKIDT